MNRHFHNTLTALVASGSLLVLGLMAAAPLVPHDGSVAPPTQLTAVAGDPAPSGPATISTNLVSVAEATAVVRLSDAIQAATIDSATTRATNSSQRARRQTLVMPYLSFLPRS